MSSEDRNVIILSGDQVDLIARSAISRTQSGPHRIWSHMGVARTTNSRWFCELDISLCREILRCTYDSSTWKLVRVTQYYWAERCSWYSRNSNTCEMCESLLAADRVIMTGCDGLWVIRRDCGVIRERPGKKWLDATGNADEKGPTRSLCFEILERYLNVSTFSYFFRTIFGNANGLLLY
jgi:hypothetical protein